MGGGGSGWFVHDEQPPASVRFHLSVAIVLGSPPRVNSFDHVVLHNLNEVQATDGRDQDRPGTTHQALNIDRVIGVFRNHTESPFPEQAKGRGADKRSDVWAFGCVLYEMLTGTRAFNGEDISDTLATVLEGQPDWAALPDSTPGAIRRLLRRSLEKDHRRRLADMADARLEIEEAICRNRTTGAWVHSDGESCQSGGCAMMARRAGSRREKTHGVREFSRSSLPLRIRGAPQ
jgi:hypothetical protein